MLLYSNMGRTYTRNALKSELLFLTQSIYV